MIKKLLLSKFKILDFYNLSIIKRQCLPFYRQIINGVTNQPIIDLVKYKEEANLKGNIHYITYIPSFVNMNLSDGLKKITFNRFIGFLANLENYDSIEGYMAEQFGSKSRSKIRSYLRRLETCFDITYKFYYGDIQKEEHQNLFEALEHMIVRRFDQRGEEHQAIKDWNYYKDTTYQNIIDKKASLFVIYDSGKPIDICLNYHFEKILINYIRAYDIDYSKFRLGYVDILKQLEWCFENNITVFDLGSGILTYKKQWCNITYKFEDHVIFNKKSITDILLGNVFALVYKLKIFLDRKNIIKDKANLSESTLKNTNTDAQEQKKKNEFEIIELKEKIELNKNHIKVDIESDEYNFLRQTVHEYLYLNFENKSNISIYKAYEGQGDYIIIGKKNVRLKMIN